MKAALEGTLKFIAWERITRYNYFRYAINADVQHTHAHSSVFPSTCTYVFTGIKPHMYEYTHFHFRISEKCILNGHHLATLA